VDAMSLQYISLTHVLLAPCFCLCIQFITKQYIYINVINQNTIHQNMSFTSVK